MPKKSQFDEFFICYYLYFLSKTLSSVMHFVQDISDVPIMSYDPLPPLDSIDTYSRSGPGRSSNLDDPSILGMFFRSLLPNFNPNDPNPPDLQLPEGYVMIF